MEVHTQGQLRKISIKIKKIMHMCTFFNMLYDIEIQIIEQNVLHV